MRVVVVYLCRFAGLWLFWFWAPVVDVLMLATDPYVPGFSIPKEVHIAVLAVGFVIANVKLFADAERVRQSLQMHIDELESTKANIQLEFIEAYFYHSHAGVPCPFAGVRIDQSGFEEHGLPGWASIRAKLELKNTGYEPGELVWALDRAQSYVPPLFAIDEEYDGEFDGGPLRRIEPQAWLTVHWKLPVRVAERDPRAFARALSSLTNCSFVIDYHTRRIDGQSRPQSLRIEADLRDFREKVLEYWGWRHNDLAQVAKRQAPM